MSLLGNLTAHRFMTVFPWVHHLTIVWLMFWSQAQIPFWLWVCSPEVIPSRWLLICQCPWLLLKSSLPLVGNSLTWKTRKENTETRTDAHLPNDYTAVFQMILWDKASVCLRSQVEKLWNGYFFISKGILGISEIRMSHFWCIFPVRLFFCTFINFYILLIR